jgi:hypothetical protein
MRTYGRRMVSCFVHTARGYQRLTRPRLLQVLEEPAEAGKIVDNSYHVAGQDCNQGDYSGGGCCPGAPARLVASQGYGREWQVCSAIKVRVHSHFPS